MESFGPKTEEVVSKRERVREDSSKENEKGWQVSYTNINGLVSTLTEVNDYLRAKKPDILGLVETKLSDSEDVPVGEGQYNVWRRNRNQKKGGGVMMLTRKDVVVGNVEKGEGMAEVLKVELVMKKGRIRDLVLVYVPPKTNSWGREEYGDMIRDTSKCLKNTMENCENIILMGGLTAKKFAGKNGILKEEKTHGVVYCWIW